MAPTVMSSHTRSGGASAATMASIIGAPPRAFMIALHTACFVDLWQLTHHRVAFFLVHPGDLLQFHGTERALRVLAEPASPLVTVIGLARVKLVAIILMI